MKKYVAVLFSIIILYSCEDVVEIDVPSEEPRLVIDALIRVDINEEFVPIEVKLATTSNFFGAIPAASAESVIILIEELDDNGVIIGTSSSSLAETSEGSGIYVPDPNFSSDQRIRTSFLERNLRFLLVVEYEGRDYIGRTKYVPVVPIDDIVIGNETLFDGDETEVIVSFTDEPDREDFYVFDFDFGEYLVTEDEFFNGQQFEFSYFYDRTFETGREIDISILGADETFFNYMDQLIEQGGELQGPFQTPIATVRGNIFDATGIDNDDIFDNVERPGVFPLGYFAIVQEFKRPITIE